MQLHNTPADPWSADRPRSTAPRLTAYVHARPTRAGGVINLSAALWGGHFERTVPLTVHEARGLGRELQTLADPLAAGSRAVRLEGRARGRRGEPASLLAAAGGAATDLAGARLRSADVDSTPVRPMARSGSPG